MIYPGFCDQTYRTFSPDFAEDRCVNWYPEPDQSGNAKTKMSLIGVPGLATFITLPASPVRCIWPGDDKVYAVAGTKYGEIVAGPAFQDRGTIANSGDERAYIFSNGIQLLIISGGSAYFDNGAAASGANAVLIGAAGSGISGTYIDGYGVRLEYDANGRSQVYISASLDFSTWDILDVQARVNKTDKVVALWNHQGNLWLIGKRSIDAWYNSGNADYPFQPIRGSTIDIGTEYPHTIAELDGSLFFLHRSENGSASVLRTRGYSLERVSTFGVERFFEFSSSPVAYAYEQNGHEFYCLLNPGSVVPTFCYDATTKLWHERGHWNAGGGYYDPHLARCHANPTFAYAPSGGAHLVGARNSGKVYYQRENDYTFDGAGIRCLRQLRPPHGEDTITAYHRLELDIQTGTQASGTPDANYSYSENGGRTFNTPRAATLGAIGDYAKRVIWRRNGSSRDRIDAVDLTVTGPVAVQGAYIDVSMGNA